MLARLTIQAEIIVPLFLHGLCAGFPSPADDFMDETIDLTRLLVTNPPATFLWKVDGHSMRDAGIYDKDLLVVDRSLAPRHGDVVVATVHGERSLKRLHMDGGHPRLSFENRDMPAFDVPDIAEVEIWGVAKCNVHWLRMPASKR